VNRRAAGFWIAIIAALLAVGALTGGRQQSGPPLHPESTDPTGTRALMILLDELGVDIIDRVPDDSIDTALVLADNLDEQSRADLEDWVSAGGSLVVTDPNSSLSPPEPVFDNADTLDAGVCTVDGIDGLQVEARSFLLYPRSSPGRSSYTADGWCFGDQGQSFVHVRERGAGRVVSLGGGLMLSNENLDEADNAVVAARLLLGPEAPDAGGTATVAVLFDPVAAAGARSLSDLIPSGAKWAALQLLVAFGLYVLWRIPRFGRPVTEPQPVELPASLLVRAAGELHRRSGGHGQASATLRADLDRRLRRQLRVSPELPAAELVDAAAAGGVVDPDVVGRALAAPDAVDGSGLSALVADIDTVNRSVLGTADDHGAVADEPAALSTSAAMAGKNDPTIGANT
jgi:hypothetical protein